MEDTHLGFVGSGLTVYICRVLCDHDNHDASVESEHTMKRFYRHHQPIAISLLDF